eukprot:TRINITY_DN2985_c0_g1_i1.p1 TRINITY_DN2985_c0_g1~~TRINITY_DN2985_c0_g1_i1.p1  ORF type:complete len:888 (-),score=209.61 TRINITY_DN2985_c0_g1_i1:904-3567(-)
MFSRFKRSKPKKHAFRPVSSDFGACNPLSQLNELEISSVETNVFGCENFDVSFSQRRIGLELQTAPGGFGVYVHGFVRGDEDNMLPAERSRLIKVSDLLLAINDEDVSWCSLDEIHERVVAVKRPFRMSFRRLTTDKKQFVTFRDIFESQKRFGWFEHYLRKNDPKLVYQLRFMRAVKELEQMDEYDVVRCRKKAQSVTSEFLGGSGNEAALLKLDSNISDCLSDEARTKWNKIKGAIWSAASHSGPNLTPHSLSPISACFKPQLDSLFREFGRSVNYSLMQMVVDTPKMTITFDGIMNDPKWLNALSVFLLQGHRDTSLRAYLDLKSYVSGEGDLKNEDLIPKYFDPETALPIYEFFLMPQLLKQCCQENLDTKVTNSGVLKVLEVLTYSLKYDLFPRFIVSVYFDRIIKGRYPPPSDSLTLSNILSEAHIPPGVSVHRPMVSRNTPVSENTDLPIEIKAACTFTTNNVGERARIVDWVVSDSMKSILKSPPQQLDYFLSPLGTELEHGDDFDEQLVFEFAIGEEQDIDDSGNNNSKNNAIGTMYGCVLSIRVEKKVDRKERMRLAATGNMTRHFYREGICVLSSNPCFDAMRNHLREFSIESGILGSSKSERVFKTPAELGRDELMSFLYCDETTNLQKAMESCAQVLLRTLSKRTLLKLLAALFLERQVVLMSSKLSLVSRCILGLKYLLKRAGLDWPHVCIPVLPSEMHEVCECPSPYLIGVHSSLMARIPDVMAQCIVCDLDGSEMINIRLLPKMCPIFEAEGTAESMLWSSVSPDINGLSDPFCSILPQLPSPDAVSKTLSDIYSTIVDGVWKWTVLLTPNSSSAGADISITNTSTSGADKEIAAIFNVSQFLDLCPPIQRDFYNELFQTQLFSSFVSSRL